MLLPQLAKQAEITSLESFINDDNWVMEQKLDGHRLLLCSPGGNFPPTALTRAGSPYTRKLPQSLRDFRFPEVTAGAYVFDGELVGDVFHVFDVPRIPIDNGNTLELAARRLLLENVLDIMPHPFHLVPQAKTRDEKIKLAEIAMKNNFEGLLLKRRNSGYVMGGRTDAWLKVKFVTTADCIVLDVRDDGKDSVRLGMVADGDMRAICDIGRASLIGKEKGGVINKGDVIEVRYLYCGAGGRLYQPTIMRKRDDKAAHECTTDQLKFVCKDVLDKL